MSPFFDFQKAEFRHNGDWLRLVTLPRLIEVTAHVPLSMSLQREDFRNRLAAGHSLSLAELLYSVAMALDSVEVHCDLEVGGLDQYLNMQMCRKVMEICGQEPELVVATSLLEGTDGTGAKMSKSRGNYVPLTAPAHEMFGKLMSIPDRLMEPYLKALSEWDDKELAIVRGRLSEGSLHPMDMKKIVAGEVTAALHGVDAAMRAREEFEAQFSRRKFAEVEDLPEVTDLSLAVVDVVKALGFASSNSEVRRVAEQNGLRLVVEPANGDGQEQLTLGPDDIRKPLSAVLSRDPNIAAGALLPEGRAQAGSYFPGRTIGSRAPRPRPPAPLRPATEHHGVFELTETPTVTQPGGALRPDGLDAPVPRSREPGYEPARAALYQDEFGEQRPPGRTVRAASPIVPLARSGRHRASIPASRPPN